VTARTDSLEQVGEDVVRADDGGLLLDPIDTSGVSGTVCEALRHAAAAADVRGRCSGWPTAGWPTIRSEGPGRHVALIARFPDRRQRRRPDHPADRAGQARAIDQRGAAATCATLDAEAFYSARCPASTNSCWPISASPTGTCPSMSTTGRPHTRQLGLRAPVANDLRNRTRGSSVQREPPAVSPERGSRTGSQMVILEPCSGHMGPRRNRNRPLSATPANSEGPGNQRLQREGKQPTQPGKH
jgi:hypothetical protein